jgi:excinuclease ABC subunit B
MVELADEMEFEKAAVERDRLTLLKEMDIGIKPPLRSTLAGPKPKQEQRMMGRRAQPRKYRRRR